MTPDIVKSLLRNRFLRSLSDDTLSDLLAGGELTKFQKGDTLSKQGEPVTSLLFIVSGGGEARMEAGASGPDAMELGSLQPGDDIGVLSLVDGAGHSATVTALDATEAIKIDIEDVWPHLATNPTAYRVLAEIAMDRLVTTRRWLQTLTLGADN